jgi:hypothetical protein
MEAGARVLIEDSILMHPISRRGDRMKKDGVGRTGEMVLGRKMSMNGEPFIYPRYFDNASGRNHLKVHLSQKKMNIRRNTSTYINHRNIGLLLNCI